MKALQTVKSILAVVSLVALGILTGALVFRKPKSAVGGTAEKAKEDKKNEIENTPASVLVASANDADDLGAIKDGIKADFRERIRNRLDAELHRLGSGSTPTDCVGGSGSGD